MDERLDGAATEAESVDQIHFFGRTHVRTEFQPGSLRELEICFFEEGEHVRTEV